MRINIFTFLMSVLLFISCTNEIEQVFDKDSIYIRLENASDYNIDNVVFSELDFGKVKKDKKTTYDKLEYLGIYGMQSPMVSYEISFKNKNLEQGIGFCGTGVSYLEPGKYTIEIDFPENCLSNDCYPLFQIVED